MKDEITLTRIKLLHPKLQDEALFVYNELYEKNIFIRFTSTYRSFEEQDVLYSQGRIPLDEVNFKRKELKMYELKDSEHKIVTKAKGGNSYHNYGLAIDFCLLDKNNSYNMKSDMNKNNKSDWMEVVEVFKKYGWEWGAEVNFKGDTPHFQKRLGYDIKELLIKYNTNDFIEHNSSNYKYLNI